VKTLPFRVVKRKLEKADFAQAGQTGSHVKFAKITNHETRTAIVPKHREVASGTFGVFCVKQVYPKKNLGNSDLNLSFVLCPSILTLDLRLGTWD
jgi:predicted RNA binding protein YcfA (HicA-like mRNA interferase family)